MRSSKHSLYLFASDHFIERNICSHRRHRDTMYVSSLHNPRETQHLEHTSVARFARVPTRQSSCLSIPVSKRLQYVLITRTFSRRKHASLSPPKYYIRLNTARFHFLRQKTEDRQREHRAVRSVPQDDWRVDRQYPLPAVRNQHPNVAHG